MAADELYRSAARRAHRQLSLYLLTQAWSLGTDCVVVTRAEMMRYLKLSNMQRTRLRWFEHDLKPEFPHAQAMFTARGRSWQTIYLSRLPFPDGFGARRMMTSARVAELNERGLRTAEVPVPTEDAVLERLARLAVGLAPVKPYRRRSVG